MSEADLDRLSRLLRAAWESFDAAADAARASGVALRTGPRGGGRDVDKMQAHVAEAEQAYLTKLGSRSPKPATRDAVRATVLATLSARVRGEELSDPSAVRERWTPRYFLRRSAWHALDHAWEIEDRSS